MRAILALTAPLSRFTSAPRKCSFRFWGNGLGAAMLALPVFLGGCTPVPPAAQQARRTPIQSFAPATMQPIASDASETVKLNLPSAPLDTPLCGTALRERAQMGAKIYPQSLASGNACTANACFQPLTGTYIAANGAPMVCR